MGRWRRGVCAGYGREECDKERERRIVWRERETKLNCGFWSDCIFTTGLFFQLTLKINSDHPLFVLGTSCENDFLRSLPL